MRYDQALLDLRFYNPLALECCMKDLPHRWWVHFLYTKNVDVVLKEDSNETD